MARLHLRLFGNLAFLQTLDKPNILSKLLRPHNDYFMQQGLNVDSLTNDDTCARELLKIFTGADEHMPGDLLQGLYRADQLADEDGYQKIEEEARVHGIDLGEFPGDVTAGDLAILALINHPGLVRVCCEKIGARQVKRYYEFRSKDHRRFSIDDIRQASQSFEAALGIWFEKRKRTRACELTTYMEDNEIVTIVTHGALFQADGNITDDLRFSRLGWRPQKHDSFVYDTRTGVLKVHARYPAERQLYRQTLGEVLAQDTGYFLDNVPYTLESLRRNDGFLTLADGIDGARLTEVEIEVGAADCRDISLHGDDMTKLIAGEGSVIVPPGEIVRGIFLIKYSSGGRERKLEIRLPNIAEFDREKDGSVTEAFIRSNDFVAPVHDDPDGIMDAA